MKFILEFVYGKNNFYRDYTVQCCGFIQCYYSYTHSEYRVVVVGEKNKTKRREDMSSLGNFVHVLVLFSLCVINSAIIMMHYKSMQLIF